MQQQLIIIGDFMGRRVLFETTRNQEADTAALKEITTRLWPESKYHCVQSENGEWIVQNQLEDKR